MKKPGLAIAAVFLLTALPALHAAPADPVPVRVSIRGADGKPLDPAYVAFVAPSRPGWRPSAEAVAADGVATLRVRPGHYRVIAGAPRHPEEARNVEVREAMQVGFELPRSVPIGGTVVDETGTPIAGARVRHARLLGAVQAAQVTETARRFFESDWSTVTGDDGRWTLPGRANGTVPLYIDAPGYAPVHELRGAGDAEKATTLVRGGMLQLVLDRADGEQMLTLARSGIDGTTVAREPWESVAWSRPAATTITWDSLPAGRYQVIAHPVDPRHFSTPRPVGTFTVNTGATADARASLPRLPRKELEPVVLHVPNRTPKELAALTPFASSPDGADELQYALERVSRGTLVYLLTKAAPEALFLAATDAIITAAPEGDGTMDAPRRTVTWPRADITVRLVRAETAPPLPAWVASEFYGCGPLGRIGLTIAPSQDGVLRLPFPTTCRGVVLRLAPFESLVVAASLTPGERRELGPFTLALGASVAIQVAREPGGAAVPGALVRATTAPGEVHELVFAEGVAGVDGTLLLAGLPAGRDLAIIARDPVTEVTGSAAARAEGGGVTSVRVPLAAPASVVMTLRLGAALRAKSGEARIHSVVLDAPELARSARRSAPLDEKGQVRFDGLSAGKWQPLVLVEAPGTTIQPVPLEALTLAAGETRTVDEEIDPPLFEGRVVSRGRGLPSQVAFGESPKPGSVTRHARTDDEGRFRILLPARGVYRVTVRRSLKAEDQIEIGEVAFEDPARPVRIEVPATTLKIVVRDDGNPVAGARVSAALTRTTGYGSIGEALLRGTTNGEGVFRLDGLLPGRWLVQASSGTSERRGAAAVEVKSGDVTVEVELLAPAKLAGTVRDADGAAAGDATVACLHTGAGGLPQVSRTRTDEAGAFTIELPAPPPARLRCGVATRDQRIGTFTTGSVENASVVLRPERGTLTIPDWGTRPAPNTYWLVSPAGDVFDLSWAATRAPALTLSGLPSGPWTIVRATRPDDLLRLATGAASALPSVASFNIRTDEVTTVDLH